MQKVRLTPLGKIVILVLVIIVLSGFRLIERGLNKNDNILAKDSGTPGSEESVNVSTKDAGDSLESLKDINLSINFNPNIAMVKKEYYQALDVFAEVAKSLDDLTIQIEGNTADPSKSGNTEFDMKLSLQRAKVVSDYLIKKGISPDRIIVNGNGTDKPLGDNDTKNGRELNRRADIFFKLPQKGGE